MIRILLPLAVIAAILFAPMYSVEINDPVLGEKVAATKTGYAFIENTVDCWKKGEYSIKDKCEPKGDMKGMAIFAATFGSAVAAALGVLGLLPFIGKLTSFVTTAAGAVVIAAIGYFALTMLGGKGGETIQWGSYLAGGGGLLMLISGLAGVRGR